METIKPIVDANDNSRWYATSSPSNGLKTIEDGYVSQNPGSPLYGDGKLVTQNFHATATFSQKFYS